MFNRRWDVAEKKHLTVKAYAAVQLFQGKNQVLEAIFTVCDSVQTIQFKNLSLNMISTWI